MKNFDPDTPSAPSHTVQNSHLFQFELHKTPKINHCKTYHIFQSWNLSNQIRRLAAPEIKRINGNARVTRDKKKLKRQTLLIGN